MTRDEEINNVHGNGTHVVLLGAGATLASTLRNPEKNGKQLPLMRNLVDVVGMNDIVSELPGEIQENREDFEKLFSQLGDSKFFHERQEMEKRVFDYFKELKLPDEPTIYDYLILSLRHEKDVIATFNWDPFLFEAYQRNSEFVDCPGILFLHGCVSLGYDDKTSMSGPAGWNSKETGNYFKPTQLLYPVDKKDYVSDAFVNGQWEQLSLEINKAKRISVFGYSAPKTDIEAIALLQKAWGTVESRSMEQFEIINSQSESSALESWKTFIHSHHYDYSTNYFDSSLALHPRRTVESYRHKILPNSISEFFQRGNPVPQNFNTLEELWEWHLPLIKAERKLS